MNLLDYLSKEELTLFKISTYKKGDIIFHENDKCNYTFIILEGEIKIVSYSLNGDENIISIHKKNDIFANALIFSSNPYFLGDIICNTNSKILSISKSNLIKILQTNKQFLINYINVISEKTINLNIRTKLLGHKNIRSRIIYYFEINHYKIPKNISKMSKELILPRPSVSREIHKMINENIIIEEKKYLYLNK